MQTHDDMSHLTNRDAFKDILPIETHDDFLKRLQDRAAEMTEKQKSTITAGKEGESVLREWEFNGILVRELPEDEQHILRISIGGGTTILNANYCVFRGQKDRCIDLLRKALIALQQG